MKLSIASRGTKDFPVPKLIQLSECKRPEQARKVDDPNYCKYHRVIGSSVTQ
ncbi:Retrotransposon gag protein [Cucumis melo var. makuwa]|uniref:Retrotransposon gag protein n=1 Tax=Cucumis melo var. makuwa TaxID=1194695 RepID=A0A5A7TXV4_CUCMM|nr:Retrotransposon gag protein [Cucumis melo var. makuwa]TYK02404.1 Retrotransposon gag protein [Cucumis melo var. makuwa]